MRPPVEPPWVQARRVPEPRQVASPVVQRLKAWVRLAPERRRQVAERRQRAKPVRQKVPKQVQAERPKVRLVRAALGRPPVKLVLAPVVLKRRT